MKTFIIDLKGVRNTNDLVYRFYKALEYFPHVSEEERLKRIEKYNHQGTLATFRNEADDHPGIWSAFKDDMSGLDINENEK